jgi:hypothetical protein
MKTDHVEPTTVIPWHLIDGNTPKSEPILLTDGGCVWQGFHQNGYGWITGYDDGVVHVRITIKPTHWAPLAKGPSK